jgi:hypothetical protein
MVLEGETEVVVVKPVKCQCVYLKSHIDWRGIEGGSVNLNT